MSNDQLYNALSPTTKGATAIFLLWYGPRTDCLAERNAAWSGLTNKYLISSQQRRRFLMLQLDSISSLSKIQTFMTRGYQLRDCLSYIGETWADERMKDITLKGLPEEYEIIEFNAERDAEF